MRFCCAHLVFQRLDRRVRSAYGGVGIVAVLRGGHAAFEQALLALVGLLVAPQVRLSLHELGARRCQRGFRLAKCSAGLVVGPGSRILGGGDFAFQHVDIGLGGIAGGDVFRGIKLRDQVALVNLRALIDGQADHASRELRADDYIRSRDDTR